MIDNNLLSAIQEAKLLGIFKKFCEKNNSIDAIRRLRNIFNNSVNISQTVNNLLKNDQGVNLTNNEISRMIELIQAFLKKSTIRKDIPIDVRRALLNYQNGKCKICGKDIDLSGHADHIVPFKYVGDELHDNIQMLCTHCNEQKNASIDYQVRYLLGTI